LIQIKYNKNELGLGKLSLYLLLRDIAYSINELGDYIIVILPKSKAREFMKKIRQEPRLDRAIEVREVKP